VNDTREFADRTVAGRRAVLVNVAERDPLDTSISRDEMRSLARTLRLAVVQEHLVRVDQPHRATFIGRGKAEELGRQGKAARAEVFVCAADLSPIQQRNLEEILETPVIDRTGVILRIFAEHARSAEGKIQVELASLAYLLPRLAGHGAELSRLGGGIGTRGPGEMKLEVMRRRIKDRMHRLSRQVADIERHRQLLRHGRRRRGMPLVSILGYTNVGKSSLLNALSRRGDLCTADQLFSTLDPATRAVALPDGHTCLVSDTVGLLHRLPHHLIAAFRATLEEAAYADLLLCVYDGSSQALHRQRETTEDVIRDLGLLETPRIDICNKVDAVPDWERAGLLRGCPDAVLISCRTGEGIPELRQRMQEALNVVAAP